MLNHKWRLMMYFFSSAVLSFKSILLGRYNKVESSFTIYF